MPPSFAPADGLSGCSRRNELAPACLLTGSRGLRHDLISSIPTKAVTARILIVEDEPSISETIAYALESDGFEVATAGTGAAGFEEIRRKPVDLVVLDVGLPDVNGFDWCRTFRQTSEIPVLFLTARSSEVDRVVGLEIGGDDYVAKPFSPRELTARVRAILRRAAPAAEPLPLPQEAASGFEVDAERYQIRYKGKPLSLSRYEYRILGFLIEHPGRVYTRAQLMDHAWEEPEASMERTVDSHIKSIRSKLREIHPESDPIVTHRGIGYSLAENM
jgi:two-component system catabolic regulation response regulator CreB